MANNSSLNQLLQWSIENSDSTRNDSTTTAPPSNPQRDPRQGFDSRALAELLGGPSDADRMRGAMAAIVAPLDQVDLENKSIAWDNFEQLIEQIDNANNMEPMGLWAPLVQQLDSPEAEMRRMACWCCSTAVQNNIKCQESLLAVGAIPRIAVLATRDPSQAVRKKAISALSSEVRNFQPGLDELLRCLPAEYELGTRRLDAASMDEVDEVVQKMRDSAARL